jgi:hypothetical protein
MINCWHVHCLNLPVQKTVYDIRSPHPAASGTIFCFAASLLTFAVISTFAGEPAMIAALNQRPEKLPAPPLAQLECVTKSLYFVLPGDQPEVVSLKATDMDFFLPISHIEFQTNAIQAESFLLVRENSHSRKPLTVEAGYGRIWDDKSTLQKICSDYQDPGCAYVRASFNF